MDTRDTNSTIIWTIFRMRPMNLKPKKILSLHTHSHTPFASTSHLHDPTPSLSLPHDISISTRPHCKHPLPSLSPQALALPISTSELEWSPPPHPLPTLRGSLCPHDVSPYTLTQVRARARHHATARLPSILSTHGVPPRSNIRSEPELDTAPPRSMLELHARGSLTHDLAQDQFYMLSCS